MLTVCRLWCLLLAAVSDVQPIHLVSVERSPIVWRPCCTAQLLDIWCYGDRLRAQYCPENSTYTHAFNTATAAAAFTPPISVIMLSELHLGILTRTTGQMVNSGAVNVVASGRERPQ